MENHRLQFTPFQNKLITACLTLLAAAVGFAVLCGFLYGFTWVLGRLGSVLFPPLAAIVLAMLLRPFYERLRRWLWASHALAVAVLLLIVFVPAFLVVYFFGNMMLQQGIDFITKLPTLLIRLETWFESLPQVQKFLTDYDLQETVACCYRPETWINGDSARLVGERLAASASRAFGWILFPVYTVFFLVTRPLGGSDVRKVLAFASPRVRDNAALLVDQFLTVVVNFFRGQIMVSCIMGCYYGTAYYVVGLSYGFFIGLFQGLFNVIPYLGTFFGVITASAMAFLGDGGSAGLFARVIAAFAVGQCLDLYLVTPQILKYRTGLSAIVIIFSLFFWHAVIGGILGVILAIPMTALVIIVWRMLKQEFNTEI